MDNNSLAGLFLLFLSIILYAKHRNKQYKGEFKKLGSYTNVSPLKHDLFKHIVVDFFPLVVFGLGSKPFFNTNNLMGSKLTETIVAALGYFVFYELVEPYVLSKTPNL